MSRQRSRRITLARRTLGFTLLEVLVALVVLTITLGAVVKAASEHTRNTVYLQERTLAHWVAQNLMARYEARLLSAEPGLAGGTMRQGERDWAYRVEIRDVQPEAEFALLPIRRIEISVWSADESADEARARLVGFTLP